jgi:hypothetical protein
LQKSSFSREPQFLLFVCTYMYLKNCVFWQFLAIFAVGCLEIFANYPIFVDVMITIFCDFD